MAALEVASQGSGSEAEFPNGVRNVVLHLPEDEGEGLGFQLTRTLWDPYPWVREVTPGSRAADAGLKTGDCLLQVDGQDLLGITVGKVAGMIRGDGDSRVVSLLAWNCGVDPTDDPELLWSCGGAGRGERARRVLAAALRALACAVCAATVRAGRSCPRGHLFCLACWGRLQRCALCREPLPPRDAPHSRNLVAEQIYEAIAAEYGTKSQTAAASAQCSPRASPRASPAAPRRSQYQLSLHKQNRSVHFDRTNYASDPNIHRSSNVIESRVAPTEVTSTARDAEGACARGAAARGAAAVPRRLLAGLQLAHVSRSLNNIHVLADCCTSSAAAHSSSLDNLKSADILSPDAPVFLVPAPAVYLLACDHEKTQ